MIDPSVDAKMRTVEPRPDLENSPYYERRQPGCPEIAGNVEAGPPLGFALFERLVSGLHTLVLLTRTHEHGLEVLGRGETEHPPCRGSLSRCRILHSDSRDELGRTAIRELFLTHFF
jgi:hypothetical protein